MSWSTSTTGTPAKVVEYLEKYSATSSGPSKDEFDKAKPHIVALVEMNYGGYAADVQPIIRLNAYGSAQGDNLSRCAVNIEVIDTKI